MADPTTTPVTTPTPTPTEKPWREQFTDPREICDQQHRELASPDVAP